MSSNEYSEYENGSPFPSPRNASQSNVITDEESWINAQKNIEAERNAHLRRLNSHMVITNGFEGGPMFPTYTDKLVSRDGMLSFVIWVSESEQETYFVPVNSAPAFTLKDNPEYVNPLS